MKKNIKNFIIFFALMLFCFNAFLPNVHAGIFQNISDTLNEFNQGAQLPTGPSDFADVIISIINIILGLLALFFIIMILYGGFTYMTAGGAPDKAKKALGIIRDAAIGVGIIFISGAIVNYVIVNLLELLK